MRTLLLIILTGLLFAPAHAQDYKGVYKVEISGDSSWHHHSMTVRQFADPVKLDFTLDLNIGPQGRAPMPHERSHMKSFEVGYEGAEVIFEMDVMGAV